MIFESLLRAVRDEEHDAVRSEQSRTIAGSLAAPGDGRHPVTTLEVASSIPSEMQSLRCEFSLRALEHPSFPNLPKRLSCDDIVLRIDRK